MSGAGTAETIADPPSGLAAHVAAENARIPTVKIEGQDHAGLSIIAPEATTAASVTSGAMTPTAIAPRLPALSLEDVGLTRTEYWRFAMKKRKAEAVNLVAKLVPLDEGLAEPESRSCTQQACYWAPIFDALPLICAVAYQWSQYFQVAPKRARSQLQCKLYLSELPCMLLQLMTELTLVHRFIQVAWQKVKRDMEEGRDPVYESEDEDDWTPQELGELSAISKAETGAYDDIPSATQSIRTATIRLLIQESSYGIEGYSTLSRQRTIIRY